MFAAGQARDEPLARQPLGGDVEQLEPAVAEVVVDLPGLGRRQARVEPGGGDPPAGQVVNLVLHQGDQRGDDHGQAVEQERRELVAEALAAAGREDRQARPAVQERGDHPLLPGAEAVEAEDLAEGPAGVVEVGHGLDSRVGSRSIPPEERRFEAIHSPDSSAPDIFTGSWTLPPPDHNGGKISDREVDIAANQCEVGPIISCWPSRRPGHRWRDHRASIVPILSGSSRSTARTGSRPRRSLASGRPTRRREPRATWDWIETLTAPVLGSGPTCVTTAATSSARPPQSARSRSSRG